MVAMNAVIDENAFAGGKFVTKSRRNTPGFCDTKFSVGVGNGTDALWFALLAKDVGPGDEVITVP